MQPATDDEIVDIASKMPVRSSTKVPVVPKGRRQQAAVGLSRPLKHEVEGNDGTTVQELTELARIEPHAVAATIAVASQRDDRNALASERLATPSDFRRRIPGPVIPWPLRLQGWIRRRTPAGRNEDTNDSRLNILLAGLATGTHTLSVIGPKGGVGKSSTALTIGLVLAQVPLARPVLVEINPDWGTLDELLGMANPRTVADLLRDYTAIDRAGIGLLQGYLTMFGRLPVLTAPSDPDAMARLTPRDYDRVLRLLAVHYNVIILDCGTAFTQRLNQFALQRADHLVVVGWPEQATMRKTLAAVEYLASARYEREYRGVLAEIAGTDGEGRGIVRARALGDVTLALNGVG